MNFLFKVFIFYINLYLLIIILYYLHFLYKKKLILFLKIIKPFSDNLIDLNYKFNYNNHKFF